MTTQQGTVGRYAGWLLAALSLGAGVIHFANAGDHFSASWWHGAFFAVVAWAQLAWAAAMVFRPNRALLVAGVAANLVVIATWLVSRTVGVPIEPGAGEPEPVGWADGLATAFEVGIVVLAAALAVRPQATAARLHPAVGRPGIAVATLAVLAVSTMALSPSFASGHAHGKGAHGGGHDAAGGHGGAGHGAGGGHEEGHTNVAITADGTSPCERWGQAPSNSGHGHRGPVPPAPMDVATHQELQAQVTEANAAVARYPTVADAKAAGYTQVSGYVPCIGAHFINGAAMQDGFDPAVPEVVLYGGIEDDAPVVGLSYMVNQEEEPEGFAGDTDVWHVHDTLCVGEDGGVLGPDNASDEECAERGGTNADTDALWMMHMWNVPGWESRWGMFSSEHPDLGGDLEDLQTR